MTSQTLYISISRPLLKGNEVHKYVETICNGSDKKTLGVELLRTIEIIIMRKPLI